jgi:prepilin-type N-terminal cleavage/methylation domain-containing protein
MAMYSWPCRGARKVSWHGEALSTPAFTLIELLAAIVLMGIISTAAALTFRSSLQSAATTNAIDQIKYLDSTSRQRAIRFNQPVALIFDLANSTLSRREGSKRNDESFTAALPREFSIDQVNIAGNSTFNGAASINCSPTGLTPSYAIHLIGPNFDQWLLFAGLSGQMTVINNEETVLDILAATRQAARRDAD